jgi:hypothetical protein
MISRLGLADLPRRRDFPLAVVAALTVLAYGLAPTGNGQVTCLLRLHADHACPGCGMSRATGRLLRADVGGAFAYHPMVFLLALQAIGFAAWRFRWGNRPLTPTHMNRLVWSVSANIAVLLLLWAVRIATGHLDNVY